MNIVMINNSRGWGGAEQILLLLSKGLQERGHTVTVFLRKDAATVAPFIKAGLKVYQLPRKGLQTLSGLATLIKVCRQENVDLVHVHRNHDLPLGKLAAFASRSPLLLTQHCQLGSTSSAVINLADHIVAVSHFIADDMLRRYPVLSNKLQVIHNGIDLSPFTNPQPGYWSRVPAVADASPLLGVIGYFYKNQEELIELLPKIREKLPKAKLVIIGKDDERQKVLEQLAADKGVSDAVYFSGKIPYAEIGDAMAGLDFNVSAFRREGCALNVIESLAVGTPFIGYRAGSYPELVIDGETGRLADSADEFVNIITELMASPTLIKRLGDSACKDAFKRFDISLMIHNYQNTYSMIAKH